ncbi:hypothetical protein IC235_17520 [Hymenobacter sp. BT664]|uniref:Uncharacterized protein n=1 Tax=Hymenobacter montanus TaxID=2771359 RepID=A0A927GKL7_9BACT|nr:hypothetical protein [Hymenobacter montanus]MBD2769692.1 hypothetical protein [Hymenobacter montanus]
MSEYTDALAAGKVGHYGFGVQMTPVASDVFGHFGFGVTLATNFLLVVLDEFGSPVDAGTSYTLDYYDPVTGQQNTLPLFHNPAVPYQATLPENQPIVFALTGSNRYAAGQTAQMTIAPNQFGVLQIRLSYPVGSVYVRITRKNPA